MPNSNPDPKPWRNRKFRLSEEALGLLGSFVVNGVMYGLIWVSSRYSLYWVPLIVNVLALIVIGLMRPRAALGPLIILTILLTITVVIGALVQTNCFLLPSSTN